VTYFMISHGVGYPRFDIWYGAYGNGHIGVHTGNNVKVHIDES